MELVDAYIAMAGRGKLCCIPYPLHQQLSLERSRASFWNKQAEPDAPQSSGQHSGQMVFDGKQSQLGAESKTLHSYWICH